MHERAQQSGPGQLLEVSARLGQATTDAFDGADRESTTDEGVQRNPPRDDVATRLLPGKVDRVEPLGLDQRHLVAVPGGPLKVPRPSK